MQREPRQAGDERERRDGPRDSRRFRLVPPAVTPVRGRDIAAGIADHLRGRGRDAFRAAVRDSLDAHGSATYTSFRRTLGACLLELARVDEDSRETVLFPAFCSSDFADAVEGVGLEPARYDVDPNTLSADLASVRDGLAEDPLAVVAVNVLGYGSPMADLAAACDREGAFLIEALGYALGTTYEGRQLGTFGDCAVLNFQQGKPLPIGGGMVVNQNPRLSFTDEGRPAVDPNVAALAGYAGLSRPRAYYAYTQLRETLGALGAAPRATTHPEAKFDVAYAEPFATLSNFQGAVGRRVFDRLDDHRAHRRRTARFYADALADIGGVETLTPVEGLSDLQFVRYPIRVTPELLRDRLKVALADRGVQATTLYDWPILDPAVSPGAADLQRCILTLPTHPYVDERDREAVVDTIRATVRGHRPETAAPAGRE